MKPGDSFLLTRPGTNRWLCSPKAEKWLLLLSDLVALSAAYCLSAAIMFTTRDTSVVGDAQYWWEVQHSVRINCFAVLVMITLAIFWVKGHYKKRRPYSNEVREVLGVALMMAVADAAIVFFGKWQFSRLDLLGTWLLVPCLLLILRTGLKFGLIKMGGWNRPLVIVGWGENAVETALAFQTERLMGYKLLAFLVPGDHATKLGKLEHLIAHRVPCIKLGAEPDSTLDSLGNPHVVLALEQGGIELHQELIQDLGRRHRNIQIVPSLRGLPLYGMEVDHFFAHEVLLLTVRNNLMPRFPRLVKRIFDICVSLLVLVLALPILLWIAARVKAGGGAIFYGHKRQGQHNQPFYCYKFRTMAPNADQLLRELLERDPEARIEWERDFKLKNDPRVTTIGKFLRRTSLDELPQLWNVLKGEMSLVGPRPVVEAELARYGKQIDYYLEAKPGITGLWQISGRNDISYESRVFLDAWYVKNWSLFSDIVILLRTVGVIFRRDGAY